MMSLPCRLKNWCGLTVRITYRLPGVPPRALTSPSPVTRTLIPSSTPAGILTTTRRLLRTRPCPRHFSQGVVMTRPSPRQRSHMETLTNWPKIDCCTRRISPVPWHDEQRAVDVPGCAPLPLHLVQVSQLGSSISVGLPKSD